MNSINSWPIYQDYPKIEKKKIAPLNDKNVMAQLKKAIKTKSEKKIDECLSFMANFSSQDLHGSLDRYFGFCRQLSESTKPYQSDLNESIYAIVKSCPNLKESLELYFNGEKGKDRSFFSGYLLELSLEKKDNQLSVLLIDLRNKFEKFFDHQLVSKIIVSLFSLYQSKDYSQIEIEVFCKAIELSKKDSDFRNNVRDYESSPEKMADLLSIAHIAKSRSLFLDCLEVIRDESSSFLNSIEPQIYKNLYKIHPREELIKWAHALLIETYLKASNQNKIELMNDVISLVSFLRFYNIEKEDEEIFLNSLDNAVAELSFDEKCEFTSLLLNCNFRTRCRLLLDSLLKIIFRWHLYQNVSFRKKMMGCFVKILDEMEHVKCWIDCFQSLPRINEENPFFTILEEYLEDLPKNRKTEVFDLMSFGIRIKNLSLINFCLRHIESSNIYHLVPLYDNYSELLHFGERVPLFHNELSIEVSERVFQIPEALLKMRAPNLLNVIDANSSFEDSMFLINFIAHPRNLEGLDYERLCRLSLLAKKAGATQLNRMAEELLFQEPFQSNAVSLMLELYADSFGKNRQKILNILLSHVLSQAPSEAIELLGKIRTIDKDSFVTIAPYTALMRLENPLRQLKLSYQNAPTLMPGHLEALSNLVPEMEELDLKNCMIGANSLKMLNSLYPNLKRLVIHGSSSYTKSLIELTEFKKLKNLELYAPSCAALRACSSLPLETLTLHQFSDVDEKIESLSDKGQKFNFSKTLQSLIIKNSKDYRSDIIGDRGATILFSHCPNLKTIALGNSRGCNRSKITKKSLELIQAQTTELHSFSHKIHFWSEEKDVKTCRALMKLIENNPTMIEYSSLGEISEKFSLKNKLFACVMDKLPGLKTLRYRSGIDDTLIAEIVQKHPDLEEIDLSNNPLTENSVPHLVKLKKLKCLTLINTKLTFEDILELTAELPELKFLTVQLKKTKFSVKQDHRKIMDRLSLRKIEVTFIDPPR